MLPLSNGAHESGDTLHTVLWTGKVPEAGAYYVRSSDDGKTWESELPIGGLAVHCDIAGGDDGPLLMAWDSRKDGRGIVLTAVSNDGGSTWSEGELISSSEESAEYPATIRLPDGFLVLWLARKDERKFLRSSRYLDEELVRG